MSSTRWYLCYLRTGESGSALYRVSIARDHLSCALDREVGGLFWRGLNGIWSWFVELMSLENVLVDLSGSIWCIFSSHQIDTLEIRMYCCRISWRLLMLWTDSLFKFWPSRNQWVTNRKQRIRQLRTAELFFLFTKSNNDFQISTSSDGKRKFSSIIRCDGLKRCYGLVLYRSPLSEHNLHVKSEACREDWYSWTPQVEMTVPLSHQPVRDDSWRRLTDPTCSAVCLVKTVTRSHIRILVCFWRINILFRRPIRSLCFYSLSLSSFRDKLLPDFWLRHDLSQKCHRIRYSVHNETILVSREFHKLDLWLKELLTYSSFL